jgi:hypothetical protein
MCRLSRNPGALTSRTPQGHVGQFRGYFTFTLQGKLTILCVLPNTVRHGILSANQPLLIVCKERLYSSLNPPPRLFDIPKHRCGPQTSCSRITWLSCGFELASPELDEQLQGRVWHRIPKLCSDGQFSYKNIITLTLHCQYNNQATRCTKCISYVSTQHFLFLVNNVWVRLLNFSC